MEIKTDLSNLRNKKFFKVKNSQKDFLCALCKSPRQMRYSKNLSEIKYIQIILLSAFLSWSGYEYIGLKSLSAILIVWPVFELTNKLLYRKEIPCPYCGFDATWYRRDVKVAKKKVEEFWSERLPSKSEAEEIKPIEVSSIDSENEAFDQENPLQ